MKNWIALIVCVTASISLPAQKSCDCNVPLMFLDEINCKPIYDHPKDCCPKKFDCSQFENRPKGGCHLLGKFYEFGDQIPEEETYPRCHTRCKCNKENQDGNSSNIKCQIVDCPEWWTKPDEGCHWRYDINKCCSVGQNCPPFDNLATCNVDGMSYYEGQKFEPKRDETVTCVCQKGFKGEFSAPHCIIKRCMFEIYESHKVENYCAPEFIIGNPKGISQCRFHFICPEDTDVITPTVSQDKCKFGKKELNVGDRFERIDSLSNIRNVTTKCECKIPPFVTCIKSLI